MKKLVLSLLLICGLSAVAQVDRSTQPKAGPAPEINLSKPQTFKLKNGLSVIVVENHKLPRVSYTLTLDNPPIAEGKKVGAASLSGALLGKGSTSISKDDFNEEVDYMGARINFGSQYASASGLSQYADRILELLADAAINPNFTEEEFKKEQELLIEGLKTNEKSVEAAASTVSRALLYGKDHPKGEFETPEMVEQVTLADAKAFYDKAFIPNNAYLVVVGDVDYKNIKKEITKNFKDWKPGAELTNDFKTPENVATTEINFVDMPNAVQSQVIVENLAELKMSDPDYFPVLIANQILGGGGEGRLFLNLREDKGYTYGAYSGIGNDKFGKTSFSASASVRNMVTDSSVVAFLEEIDRIRQEPVSEKDLKNAKAKYVGSFVRSLEQPSTVARFALNTETENLPEDFYQNYLSKINAVTIEDVQRVAKKYFLTDNSRIIVAGKGSDVIENLEKVQFKGKTIPVKYYDKEANAVEKPTFEVVLPEGVTAKTVFENYIKAIGGKDAIEGINSIVMMGEGSVQGTPLKLTIKKTSKGQFLQEISVMGNVMSKQVLNGDKASISAQGQTMTPNEEQTAALKKEAAIVPELDMMNDPSITLNKIEKVDGKNAYVLNLSDSKKVFYATESGLKLKEETTREMQGQSMVQTVMYSDYKPVQGVLFPHKLSQSVGPQNIEFTFSEINVNEGVSDADFE
ncbi:MULTISPECIES: insulinase family protein [unclassified Leeuwenhoekiella]|uniref:insulinase family protein n=1 Tax=unclassified Leeuwenhoekiella TaxID=2615029 RepID=UPI000C43FE5B|nr:MULTISPECIES: insulinase family protein [unclassified Leeuwenhoekiella]MAW96775.1 peptidase M16 [Leeuwenhoekiella sp.]MBA82370.1 peptidase M16 [Leeuwenhoekiella sp.]|tara:strand:- start:5356 stop:7425 length:2070 start_codon:yes stop_codon:yes gene_type:complete